MIKIRYNYGDYYQGTISIMGGTAEERYTFKWILFESIINERLGSGEWEVRYRSSTTTKILLDICEMGYETTDTIIGDYIDLLKKIRVEFETERLEAA